MVCESVDIPGKDSLAIGYLPGRFDTYKGFPILARALVEILPGSGNRLRFVLLGSNYVFNESKALLQALDQWIDDGSGTRPVTLLPRKTRTETEELSKGLDAVLVASRFENMPYVVLEAMASAKLVIAPRVGGIPEMIENGQTGCLFEPDSPSSLARCLEHVAALNKAEIAQIRRNAWQSAREKYDFDRLAPLYEVYYAHLIGQRAQGIRRKRPVAWWVPKQGPLLPGWWHVRRR
jgi:glycosyltransferase involved in cell wall biosynthesis